MLSCLCCICTSNCFLFGKVVIYVATLPHTLLCYFLLGNVMWRMLSCVEEAGVWFAWPVGISQQQGIVSLVLITSSGDVGGVCYFLVDEVVAVNVAARVLPSLMRWEVVLVGGRGSWCKRHCRLAVDRRRKLSKQQQMQQQRVVAVNRACLCSFRFFAFMEVCGQHVGLPMFLLCSFASFFAVSLSGVWNGLFIIIMVCQ